MEHQNAPESNTLPHTPWQKALAWILRHPAWALILVLAVSLPPAWSLPKLRVGTSAHDLVIENLPETAAYHSFTRLFESDEIIQVVIKGEDIFNPDIFRSVREFSEKALAIKGVRRVISLPDIKETVDRAREDPLAEFAALIAPVKLFHRNLISSDHRSTVVTLVLEREAAGDRVIEAVERLIGTMPPSLAVYQTGMPLVSKALADYTASDFSRLPLITLAIIAVILWVLYRNLTCLLLPLLTVALVQGWTFGLMAWIGIRLSMLTMITPILLMAVGTAYCLHLCSAYLSAARESGSAREVVYRVFSRLTVPTVLAVATTVIGLGSLALNRIEAIREFSAFTCFGMLSLLVIMLTAFPAAMSLLPLPALKARHENRVDRFFTLALERVVQLSIKYRRPAFGALALVSLFCLFGIFLVRVETNPLEYFRSGAPVSRRFHDIYQDLSGSFPLNVVMTGNAGDYFEDLNHVRELDRLQAYLETLPGVDKVITFSEYLKLVNFVLNRYEPAYYTLPEEDFELRILINNFKVILGEDTLSRFMTPDFSRTNLLLLTHLSSSREFLRTREKILDQVKTGFADDLKWDVTGFGVTISASSHHLTSGQIKSLSVTLILIFAMMALLFFSMKVGLIAIVPTLFPIIVNFGLMGWLNIHLSLATALIASIAIGLAVDDTIHYLFRYNHEFNKDLDKDRALKDTLMSVGRPMIATSITIAFGFAILMISHFKPTAIFGMLMVITMVSALIGSLILLPSLMLKVELVTAWDLLKWIPSLGGIPPGVAHELRQPLNAIKVGSAFLKRQADRQEPVEPAQLSQVVNEIGAQVDRASSIINRLIEMGEKPDRETEYIDLAYPIRGTLALMANELALDNIELKLELDESLSPVKAGYQRLSQVLFNLLTNAREAILRKNDLSGITGEKRITIRTAESQGRVMVEIEDTGPGIPAYFRDRIFEPFFSTKAEGKGNGLGLAISNQIIKDYGGRIEVESREGSGTTVRLVFPSGK